MATIQKFLDKDGVIELTRGILSTVNDRIDERIVTTISAYSDDRHVASAAAVYRAIANSKHMSGEVIVGNIDELVPLAGRRTDKIYFQKDDENDTTWSMYVWYVPEDPTEQSSWIYLGNTEINLDNYWSKSAEDVSEMKTVLGINTIESTLSGKLDKDALKAISSEELQAILDGATYDTEVFVTTHTLTINWLEPNGVTPLFEPYVAEVREGGSYKVRPPQSSQYYAPVAYVTGTMGDEDAVVNITYDVVDSFDEEDDFEWNLDITYVVPDGLTPPAAVHQTIKSGTYYSITSPTVEGYTPDIAIVSGVMEEGRTVTVTYTANTADAGASSGTSSGD